MRFHIWREVANHAVVHISTVLKRLFYSYARTEGKVKCYLRKREEQNNVLNLAWFFFSVFKAAMSLICCPPQPGDESYETFIQVCNDDLDTGIFELAPRKNYL